MWVMSERAGPLPEGALITAALKRRRLSARAAAPQAGISETRWRQITSGYQTVSGQRIPVRAPADTLARMAQIARVTPEQLIEVDRADAAEELRNLPPLDEEAAEGPEPSLRELSERLAELTNEIKEDRAREARRVQELEDEVKRLREQRSG
jgi:transcriptional regulator with XRE-family HTH domain